jgi:ubiquinone/menaquinone biosynthesis C-methylase UbiE
MHKVDIQDLPFADNTYDLVWCSHVLEHIPDDVKAMKEIRRMASPLSKFLSGVKQQSRVTSPCKSV